MKFNKILLIDYFGKPYDFEFLISVIGFVICWTLNEIEFRLGEKNEVNIFQRRYRQFYGRGKKIHVRLKASEGIMV
jgi:hypothetical protein